MKTTFEYTDSSLKHINANDVTPVFGSPVSSVPAVPADLMPSTLQIGTGLIAASSRLEYKDIETPLRTLLDLLETREKLESDMKCGYLMLQEYRTKVAQHEYNIKQVRNELRAIYPHPSKEDNENRS